MGIISVLRRIMGKIFRKKDRIIGKIPRAY